MRNERDWLRGVDRSNMELNDVIESLINQWSGTSYGESVKNMYETGCPYEQICEYIDIDYEEYIV